MQGNKTKTTKKLPFAFAIGSFVVLIALAGLTNPRDSIAIIPLFFGLLWLAVFSWAWLVAGFILKNNNFKLKTYLGLGTTAVVLFFMLKSTGEIRPIDAVILIFFVSGLAFYINRRY